MTELTRPVTRRAREARGPGSSRNLVVTLGPGDVLTMRLAGKRTRYTAPLSTVFVQLALWHANAERARRQAERQARKEAR